MDWIAYSIMLACLVAVALVFWGISVPRKDVSIVDSLWSLMFLIVALGYAWQLDVMSGRAVLVLVLVTAWSLRLSYYITKRNHGDGEDRRYQEIRANNQPGFWFKSLYIVFGLQALLAWLVAMPLALGIGGAAPLGWLDLAGRSPVVPGDGVRGRWR